MWTWVVCCDGAALYYALQHILGSDLISALPSPAPAGSTASYNTDTNIIPDLRRKAVILSSFMSHTHT